MPEGGSGSKKELEQERSLQLMGMGGAVAVVSSMVKAADLEELYGDMAMAPRRGSARYLSTGAGLGSRAGGRCAVRSTYVHQVASCTRCLFYRRVLCCVALSCLHGKRKQVCCVFVALGGNLPCRGGRFVGCGVLDVVCWCR